MKEVYNLHQHEYSISIQLENRGEINWGIDSNITKEKGSRPKEITPDYFMYDKQNMETVFWEYPAKHHEPGKRLESKKQCENKGHITINNFIDKLYRTFKKERSYWDNTDLILELAVSNFIRELVNYTIDNCSAMNIRNIDELHYICIVPYEWDDEIREELLRPIFIKSGLIAKTDHKDRLLFLSDAESFFYYTQRDSNVLSQLYDRYHRVGDHYILCEVVVGDDKKKSSIHVHLIEAQYSVLNIPEGLLYPKIIFSSTLSFNVDNIKSNLKTFLRVKLSSDDNNSYKNDCVDMIVTDLYKSITTRMMNLFEKSDDKYLAILKEPWIEVKREWKLNEIQSKYLETLSLLDICLETDKNMINAVKKGLFANSQTKQQCKILIFREERGGLRNILISLWSAAILEYISDSLNYTNTNIIRIESLFGIRTYKASTGAHFYTGDVVRNSDINSRPHILPTIEPALSSSVFLEHKMDSILIFDILPDYTLLTCAFVNINNGITEKVLDNHYFTNNKFLPPLKLFYPLSEITTLVMSERCVSLIDKHLSYDLNCIFDPDHYFQKTKKLAIEFGDILNKGFPPKEIVISTQDPKYIEAFLVLYFGYINEIILSGLPTHQQINANSTRIGTGYLISIEKRLLNSIAGTKKNLKGLIFESGLVKNNDEYKKLRIITQGEGLLSGIQKQIDLELPIKSWFVLAQLHENHVQLTLNQVVTDIGLEEDEAQEAIIVQDEIVPIENMYESLCINMWDSITQNTSLVQFCDLHYGNNGNLFTLITRNKFKESLREFISTKIFTENINFQMDSVRRMEFSYTCSCAVNLSVRDILNISIKPFLYEMASIISSSLVNRDHFGKYHEIENIFSMIHFNRNRQLQPILANLLKEEINDFNERQRVYPNILVLLDVPNQLLQPVVNQKLAIHKSFQVGDLKQISSFSYGFYVGQSYHNDEEPVYRDKIHHTCTFKSTTLIVLKKGDIINDTIVNRVIYLTLLPPSYCEAAMTIYIRTCKINSLYGSTSNRTLRRDYDGTMSDTVDIVDCEIGYFDKNKPEKKEIPLMVFVEIMPYSSTLRFSVKIIGQEVESNHRSKEVGICMALARS